MNIQTSDGVSVSDTAGNVTMQAMRTGSAGKMSSQEDGVPGTSVITLLVTILCLHSRCLETSHWEDACWVEAAHVLCPVCNVPGHLPCVHQATDFRQRKLVIDTFGWLSFKDWFQVNISYISLFSSFIY